MQFDRRKRRAVNAIATRASADDNNVIAWA